MSITTQKRADTSSKRGMGGGDSLEGCNHVPLQIEAQNRESHSSRDKRHERHRAVVVPHDCRRKGATDAERADRQSQRSHTVRWKVVSLPKHTFFRTTMCPSCVGRLSVTPSSLEKTRHCNHPPFREDATVAAGRATDASLRDDPPRREHWLGFVCGVHYVAPPRDRERADPQHTVGTIKKRSQRGACWSPKYIPTHTHLAERLFSSAEASAGARELVGNCQDPGSTGYAGCQAAELSQRLCQKRAWGCKKHTKK